jgi:hypothetical protein
MSARVDPLTGQVITGPKGIVASTTPTTTSTLTTPVNTNKQSLYSN